MLSKVSSSVKSGSDSVLHTLPAVTNAAVLIPSFPVCPGSLPSSPQSIHQCFISCKMIIRPPVLSRGTQ